MLKIAVTGHRKLLNTDAVRREIALSLAYFTEQHPSVQALSALAAGADTIFSEEAYKAGIPLRVMLPFGLADYQTDFDETERAELAGLLKKASQPYEVVNTLRTHTEEERNAAYLSTGKKMVDEADIVLAVWDGLPARGIGGTGDIVAYARAQGKELHIINAERPQKEMTQTFYPLFDKFDKEALRLKFKFYTMYWLGGIVAGLLAVFVFAVNLLYSGGYPDAWKGLWLPILEAVLVLLSFVLLGILAPKEKIKFLRNRTLAEYLRIHDLMESCGFAIVVDNKKNHKSYIIAEEIRDLEKTYSLSRQEMIDNEVVELGNIKDKLTAFINGQNKYHTEFRIARYKKWEHTIEVILAVILWAFAATVIAKLVFEVMEYYHSHFIDENDYLLVLSKFLILVLPPCYAALEGILYFSEWKRSINKSKAVNDTYNTLLGNISTCQSIPQVEKLAIDLNHDFWEEQYSWLEWYHDKKIGARI